jgi:triosephosphate isomerase
MIITNFKTYESATGQKAIDLAKIHEKAAKKTGVEIMVAVQPTDLMAVAKAVKIPVLAQHIDFVGMGGFTGHITAEAVKAAGAHGTLLNHSERRLPRDVLAKSIARAKELGLMTVVCAATPEEGATFLEFNPDLIAVEPPELIGGDISVSTSKPEVIEHSSKLIGKEKLLVGAGVKNGKDVEIAIKLGAKGVLLASGVTKAKNPKGSIDIQWTFNDPVTIGSSGNDSSIFSLTS